MYLIHCSDCDFYSRIADIGQRIRFDARLDTDDGNFRPMDRQHVLNEIHSAPERIWCTVCDEPIAEVVEVGECPCAGTTPAAEGQYWWTVRHAKARCTLCGREIQGSTVVEWSGNASP